MTFRYSSLLNTSKYYRKKKKFINGISYKSYNYKNNYYLRTNYDNLNLLTTTHKVDNFGHRAMMRYFTFYLFYKKKVLKVSKWIEYLHHKYKRTCIGYKLYNQKKVYKLILFNLFENEKKLILKYKLKYKLKLYLKKKNKIKTILNKFLNEKKIIPLIKQLNNNKSYTKKKIKIPNLEKNKYGKIFNMHIKDKKPVVKNVNQYVYKLSKNHFALPEKLNEIKLLVLSTFFNKMHKQYFK